MRPFLGIDLTKNKENEQFDGKEFLVAEPSEFAAQRFVDSSEKVDKTLERSKLPFPVRLIQWICGGIGLLLTGGILEAWGEGVSLKEGYQNASWLYWLDGICLLVWLILKCISVKKQKTVLESDESTHVFSNLGGICNAIYDEFSVPSEAKEVDVLVFCYKIKNNKVKVCSRFMQTVPFSNSVFKIFSDSENIYLANLEGKYAFPRLSVRNIHTVNKRIRIIGWNKEESPKKGIYKQYKINAEDNEVISCKPYYILEVIRDGEAWGIFFPCYELPIFEELTGLKAK